ncbi:MAG: tetratricopeptide repeat protein [Myxococcota bacterium]|nr:tetratricopeptide repeat protein [Myxococcota bacterium]
MLIPRQNIRYPLLALALCAGCRTAGLPLDPNEADGEIGLPGAQPTAYGSAAAYEHQIRGDISLARGDIDDAVSSFERALSADPQDVYLRVRLADALVRRGDLSHARHHIEAVLSSDPENEAAWLTLANYHCAVQDDASAESAAKRAIRVEPEWADATMWLARFYSNKGENRRAAEVLGRLIKAVPTHAGARLALARASLALDNKVEAHRQLFAFIELVPHRTDVLAELALMLFESASSQQAADIAELALLRDPINETLRAGLVQFYVDLGLTDRAQRHLGALPPPSRDTSHAIVNRACLIAKAGDPYQARFLIVSRLGPSPSKPLARLVLADIETTLGRLESAQILLKTVPETSDTDELDYRQQLVEALKIWPEKDVPCRLPVR